MPRTKVVSRGRKRKPNREQVRNTKVDFACTLEEKVLLQKWAVQDGAVKKISGAANLSVWLREQVGLQGKIK